MSTPTSPITTSHPQLIELIEHVPQLLPREALPEVAAEALWRRFHKQVAVEFPSPRTQGQWQLTSQGWVGFIPLSPQLHLALRPKVPLHNLFRMWEYSYQLPMQFLPDLVACQTIEEFYESLAAVLSKRVLERARHGLYRAYVSREQRLPYLRGRLDAPSLLRAPWQVNPLCHYQEQTVDVEENQIVLRALWGILHGGCGERVKPLVREAFGNMRQTVTLLPLGPEVCVDRCYGRLNADYQSLHALCRFFLEGSGPSHEPGERAMLPFLVDMERLFETFVAQWLKANLPSEFGVRAQQRVPLSLVGENEKPLSFRPDLVLSDTATGKPLCVVDTKYQDTNRPSTEDVAQVVAYATAIGCREARLVYPLVWAAPWDIKVGAIRVRSVSFDLGTDLEQAGRRFLRTLLYGLASKPARSRDGKPRR